MELEMSAQKGARATNPKHGKMPRVVGTIDMADYDEWRTNLAQAHLTMTDWCKMMVKHYNAEVRQSKSH